MVAKIFSIFMQKRLQKIGLFLIAITTLLFDVGCGSKKAETERHAFLLGSETLYCVDLPSTWVADLSDARHLALYWPDKQEGDVCSLSVSKEKYDLGRIAQIREEYDTVFNFANGMVGLEQFYEQEGALSDYGKDEKQYLVEKIFSDNMTECVNVRMEKEKYERNRAEMEQVIHTSYFQKERVGMVCDKPLEERKSICVHTNNEAFAIRIMVPEGVLFYEGAYDWHGDDRTAQDTQLIFYLDDAKEEYVQIFSDCQGYLCEDERLVWQHVQYDIRQITDAGQLVRNFQFEEDGAEYYWFSIEEIAVCVNVKDGSAKKVAKAMVESIRTE